MTSHRFSHPFWSAVVQRNLFLFALYFFNAISCECNAEPPVTPIGQQVSPLPATSGSVSIVKQLVPPMVSPPWTLLDSKEIVHSSQDLKGNPTVILFFRGHDCLHCVKQLAIFSKVEQEFRTRGVRIVAIGSTKVASLRTALESYSSPFTLLSDSRQKVFKEFGSGDDESWHGTFLLDARNRIVWQATGQTPFRQPSEILRVIDSFKEIRNPLIEHYLPNKGTAVSQTSGKQDDDVSAK